MWLPGHCDEEGGCSRAVPMAKRCREGERASSEAQKQGGGEEEHREADPHPSHERGSGLTPGCCRASRYRGWGATPWDLPRPSSESVVMLSKARAVCALPSSLDTVAEDYKCC